jgi:hypothetical protein
MRPCNGYAVPGRFHARRKQNARSILLLYANPRRALER